MSIQNKVFFSLLGLTLLCLSLLKIWITYQLTSMDALYPQVLEHIQEIKKENMQLEDQVLQEESFTAITERARQMGFTATPFIVP